MHVRSLALPFFFDSLYLGETTARSMFKLGVTNEGLLYRAVAIVALIARSKLVPDFALTIHFLHLVATTLYSRAAPRHIMWWITMIASSAICVAAGMWGCRYRELQPVFFGGGRILGNNATPAAAAATRSGDDDYDEEMGLVKAKAGNGEEYEMGKVKASR